MMMREANATMEDGRHNMIAEMDRYRYWDTILKAVPWYGERCLQPVFDVVRFLLRSHDRYNELTSPEEREYEDLGMEVHKFLEHLKHLHPNDQTIERTYFQRINDISEHGFWSEGVSDEERLADEEQAETWKALREGKKAGEEMYELTFGPEGERDRELMKAMANVELGKGRSSRDKAVEEDPTETTSAMHLDLDVWRM